MRKWTVQAGLLTTMRETLSQITAGLPLGLTLTKNSSITERGNYPWCISYSRDNYARGMSWIVCQLLEGSWRKVWNQMRREPVTNSADINVRITTCELCNTNMSECTVYCLVREIQDTPLLYHSCIMLEKAWHVKQPRNLMQFPCGGLQGQIGGKDGRAIP